MFLFVLSISCSNDCPVCPSGDSPTSNRTWYIKLDGTGDAPTIQAGIDSAAAGDTVLVAQGVYSDTTHILISQDLRIVNVHLYKSIKLLAEGASFNTVIDGSGSDIAIYTEGLNASAEIQGFEIRTIFHWFACVDGASFSRTNTQFSEHVSIYCEESELLISKNEILDNNAAIYLKDSPVVITDNIIHRAIRGVVCEGESDVLIQFNDIYMCGSAISCFDSESNTDITNNEISGGCGGIYANGARIVNNRLSSIQVTGISAKNSIIEDNVISEVGGTGQAISLGDSTVVRGNVFSSIGMVIEYWGKDSIVEHNTVVNGISFIFAQSLGSLLVNNNLVVHTTNGISAPVDNYIIECNNLFDISGGKYCWALSDQTGINGNISVDPQFCDANASNYYLQSNSPCAPENHPDGYACGLIGAFPVNCD